MHSGPCGMPRDIVAYLDEDMEMANKSFPGPFIAVFGTRRSMCLHNLLGVQQMRTDASGLLGLGRDCLPGTQALAHCTADVALGRCWLLSASTAHMVTACFLEKQPLRGHIAGVAWYAVGCCCVLGHSSLLSSWPPATATAAGAYHRQFPGESCLGGMLFWPSRGSCALAVTSVPAEVLTHNAVAAVGR